MFQLAKELSHSDIDQLFELGHYLTDNLISKICMLVGMERNPQLTENFFKYIKFQKLYKNHLKSYYPNLPSYNDIKDYHDKRNIYQHEFSSITTHFDKQFSIEYLNISEDILKEINIIKKNKEIPPTDYLKKFQQIQDQKSNIYFALTTSVDAITKIINFYFENLNGKNQLNTISNSDLELGLELLELYRDNCLKYLDIIYKKSYKTLIIENETIQITIQNVQINISSKYGYDVDIIIDKTRVDNKTQISHILKFLEDKLKQYSK